MKEKVNLILVTSWK